VEDDQEKELGEKYEKQTQKGKEKAWGRGSDVDESLEKNRKIVRGRVKIRHKKGCKNDKETSRDRTNPPIPHEPKSKRKI